MSVLIVGGNERMERRYKDLCGEYGHKAKACTKTAGSMKGVGKPDLVILFMNTMSHKRLRSVINETKGRGVQICHTSSATALRGILKSYE